MMLEETPVIQKASQKTMELLEVQHSHYKQAKKTLCEQFPGSLTSSSLLWGITTMICLRAPDTWEIYKLIQILSHPNSGCSIMVCITFLNSSVELILCNVCLQEVMEKMYCLCTFFLYLERVFKIPAR